MKTINETMTFREVAGVWQRVDSQEPKPLTLADQLDKLGIIIDEECQFCRIIRYYGNIKTTITYKAYTGSTVRICINTHKVE